MVLRSSETYRDKFEIQQIIMQLLIDMGKMLVSPNPNYEQYFRCVEHLKSILAPIADEKFNETEKKLLEEREKALRIAKNNAQRYAIDTVYYQKLFTALNFLAKRRGLTYEEEGEEHI